MAIAQLAHATGAWRRRWTREEYYRMVEVGILHEDDRVELIEGDILELAAEHAPHAGTIDIARDVLAAAFRASHYGRVQHPLPLLDADPAPDLAVVVGRPRDYTREHPTAAALVVEVSYSTLAYDRTDKVRIYARAGIPEYWIVNLVDQQLEVHRDPAELEDGTFGYRTRMVLRHGEAVVPVAKPGAPIAVSDLLP